MRGSSSPRTGIFTILPLSAVMMSCWLIMSPRFCLIASLTLSLCRCRSRSARRCRSQLSVLSEKSGISITFQACFYILVRGGVHNIRAMTNTTNKLSLLITGAAGRIGTAYREHLAAAGDPYALRLLDVRPIANAGGCEAIVGDLADPEVARQACAGMNTVLHLAANPHTQAEFYRELLDPNFKATYNVFRAAKDQGCSRVIFASSVNSVGGYPRTRQVRADDAPCPGNVYGVSKAFGESLVAYFGSVEKLSSIAVRIGGVGRAEDIKPGHAGFHSIFVSFRDLCHLFDRCIETPGIDFAVVH